MQSREPTRPAAPSSTCGTGPVLLPALAALLLVLVAAPAAATTFVNLPDAELADQAELVASVRVLGWERGPASELPSTRYRVEVEQVHQGEPVAGELVVHVPGGLAADGRGWEVHGAPSFAEGERAMLFLSRRADGTWGIVQLMLGAFHEVDDGGRRLAVRDLDGARELVWAEAAAPPAATEGVRDYDRFAEWIRARAAGERPAFEYRAEPTGGGAGRIAAPFELMTNQSGQCDGAIRPIRWFRFDSGGSVSWTADPGGQPGMSGGGFAELGNALAAWNDDGGSQIRYVGGGAGSGGDGHVTFDDPDDQIAGSFDCSGGVLAIGGPGFSCATEDWQGEPFRQALFAFVVTQDGAGCYFGSAGGKNGEEVFAHELGHTLGLSHSGVPDALMRASAYGGGRGARLGSDDRQGIAYLYGSGGSTPPPPPPPTVPTAPDSLAATATSSSTIALSWRDRSSNETSFRVEMLDAFGWSVLGSTPAGATGATVGGLAPATGYTFRVRACNDAGCSSPSGSASATTPAVAPPDPAGPPAAPSGLAAAALSTDAVELTWVDRSSDELDFEVHGAVGSGAFVLLGTAGTDAEGIVVDDLEPGTGYRFRVRARNGAGYSPWSAVASVTTHPSAPAPEPEPAPEDDCPDGALCLADGRFTVTVSWRDQRTGVLGVGTPIPGSGKSGYFWFFNGDNVELVVKVLDGRPVNGHWWFFYGALSDVEYTIEVVDGMTGARRTYRNEPGAICGRGDTAMLAEAPAATAPSSLSGAPLAAVAAPWEIAESAEVASGVCAPSSDRLCLAGGRFEVRVDWANQRVAGAHGVGRVSPPATPGTKSGLFWFFDPANVELVTKMIDGRAVNGHWWFFYGGLSDVDYTIHVRDTATGETRSYRNAPGEICGRGDTTAF